MSDLLKNAPPAVILEAVRLAADGRKLDKARYLTNDQATEVRAYLEEILKPSESPVIERNIFDLHADGMDER